MDNLYKTLKTYGKVKINEPLAKHTTFKIGGPAKYIVIVERIQALKELLTFLNEQGIPLAILGGGSNMLASDSGFDGVIIQIADKSCTIKDTTVVAAAGMQTVALAQATIKAGLTEFEWGVGVPGTIGGAVRGNAGATGWEMKDNVEKVEVYRDGETIILTNSECQFGYRHSIFKHNNDIILRVWLALKKGENKDSLKQALQYIKYRNETQPKGYASTGCIFKNVETQQLKNPIKNLQEIPQEFLENNRIPAGWLVEQVHMKGKKIGNAEVSERHGNFILNLGGATADDVLSLIAQIKQQVEEKYGIVLEEEIQIL
ncbi:MAG: UDP-N-acetylmuramate dehydrogenase [Candidatus Magasanikbacteria bacterium]|uniref:UDP-N-acetylenolpyruvoylglucosamine reductase n=1 Tax=Candidatus Magasanikbacteria bacterium CG10_big_fil_rev_8_21_14_0_10_38_6 TaxID=1974647 RepID=A0A2M6P0W1_9BACT|nr:UDP-N-acetylmuramate dehydrogenase [Candidatus Magasanikbacteria bacterium]NCS71660.1 UDP-N-acetylmuramate dehydrogenase [Candidatus Magasanikbacteria bacterium]PIR77372.1 MAG: UDP-N-acetylenolpyruvoylglucosamine reductase [Candidatus Magasanikbacteria bacterium CG10_big_fil_rev_8_21_14_0_10_38_6]